MNKNSKINILIVEDNESLSVVYRSYLEKQDYTLRVVDTGHGYKITKELLSSLSPYIPMTYENA